jgi:hypothetical protein
MATTTDSSVLVNLKDLFEMEVDRREKEAADRERAKHEAAAKAQAERIAREKELEAVREEERRRVELERVARDAELEARLRSLREELSDVRSQREEMRVKVAEIATREPAKSSRGSWIAGMMAAASLVAAITATAVAWPSQSNAVVQPEPAPAPVIIAVSEPVEVPPPAIVEAPAEPEPVVVAVNEPPRPRRCTTERCRQARDRQNQESTLSDQLDFGDSSDVLDHLPE